MIRLRDLLEESTASAQAKSQGLKSLGFNRWGKNGVVTHTITKNQLVPVKKPAPPVKKAGTPVQKVGSTPAMSKPTPVKGSTKPVPKKPLTPAKPAAKAVAGAEAAVPEDAVNPTDLRVGMTVDFTFSFENPTGEKATGIIDPEGGREPYPMYIGKSFKKMMGVLVKLPDGKLRNVPYAAITAVHKKGSTAVLPVHSKAKTRTQKSLETQKVEAPLTGPETQIGKSMDFKAIPRYLQKVSGREYDSGMEALDHSDILMDAPQDIYDTINTWSNDESAWTVSKKTRETMFKNIDDTIKEHSLTTKAPAIYRGMVFDQKSDTGRRFLSLFKVGESIELSPMGCSTDPKVASGFCSLPDEDEYAIPHNEVYLVVRSAPSKFLSRRPKIRGIHISLLADHESEREIVTPTAQYKVHQVTSHPITMNVEGTTKELSSRLYVIELDQEGDTMDERVAGENTPPEVSPSPTPDAVDHQGNTKSDLDNLAIAFFTAGSMSNTKFKSGKTK